MSEDVFDYLTCYAADLAQCMFVGDMAVREPGCIEAWRRTQVFKTGCAEKL